MKLPEHNKINLAEPYLARMARAGATIMELLSVYLAVWGVYTAISVVLTWI